MLLKTGLFILDYFESELLPMKTDELIKFLNKVAKSNFFRDKEIIPRFRKSIKKFKLTAELMSQFKEEEEMIRRTSENRISTLPYSKAEFAHYIESPKGIVKVHIQIK